jgi:glycosyltransferase involved in cell wall biosynthesis
MPVHGPRVAACLITRDRADVVTGAVASVRDHVDRVFVYDTGSTDDTVARLSAMENVEVEQGEWRDDFSWARNRSFEMPGEEYGWVAWLDDDDVLEGTTTIRQLVAALEDQVDVLVARYDVGPGLLSNRERVLRRSLGLVWEGAVHERILPGPSATVHYIPPHELRWVHEKHRRTRDANRNLKLLLREISADRDAARPSAPRTLYYAAVETAYRWTQSRDPALLDDMRSFLRDSLRAQPEPKPFPGGWVPLHENVVQALPGTIRQLFRRASGVA